MSRLGFILTAPCSGGDQIGSWLTTQRDVYVTENVLFGRFFEQWPTERGGVTPVMSVDRFVADWSRNARLTVLGIDRDTLQHQLLDALIPFLTEFELKLSQRRMLIDLVMAFPGTQRIIDQGIARHAPSAPVMRLVRDARDTLVDQAFRWLLRDTHGTNRYAFFVERRPNIRLDRFFDNQFLDRWGKTWSQCALAGRDWPDRSIPTLRFEDWVADRAAGLETIADALELPLEPPVGSAAASDSDSSPGCADLIPSSPTPSTSQDRLVARIRALARPFRRTVGIWTSFFTRSDGQRLHDLAGSALIEHGYVNDERWFLDLPERLDPDQLEQIAQRGDQVGAV